MRGRVDGVRGRGLAMPRRSGRPCRTYGQACGRRGLLSATALRAARIAPSALCRPGWCSTRPPAVLARSEPCTVVYQRICTGTRGDARVLARARVAAAGHLGLIMPQARRIRRAGCIPASYVTVMQITVIISGVRVTGYLRVSTERQVREGYGLADQERQIRAWCRANSHKLVRLVTDDAKSGTLEAAERPGLLEVLKDVRDRQAEGVVMRDLDRIARTLTVQEAVLAQLWKLGGRAFVVTSSREVPQDDPDDPMRTAMRQMAGVFAQLERAMAIKRMRNGRAEKHASGGYAYGGPPYGWRAVEHELVPDEAEQAVRARMRALRDSGASFRAIADALNAEGIPARRGQWHPQTVARTLERASC
jgi:DNA invertase Pin-like site-specific DNA recombinase